jgi:acyl-CoA synthetase (AMP-forming)/AMP-acid ligase II
MSGYFNRPDLTGKAMQGGWFRTGDIGVVEESGTARLVGRIKDEICRAGMKIQPAEIDALLERHPEVVEACTFGIPDSVSGEIVGIAVSVREGSPVPVGVSALREWCTSRIRSEAIPERWFTLEEIPKNARGKINRLEVREQCLPQ